jgi:hypothetical protein
MAAKAKATATLHEWQTQALASAASNAQAEGDDFAARRDAHDPPDQPHADLHQDGRDLRHAEAVNKAGRKSEMGYQMALKGLELRRDIEFGLTQNDVLATSPRKSRGLLGWWWTTPPRTLARPWRATPAIPA